MVTVGGGDGAAEVVKETAKVVVGEVDEAVDAGSFEGNQAIVEGVATGGEGVEATCETVETEAEFGGAAIELFGASV